MIKGKHWPIPKDLLLDGSILSLKNADRLTQDAKNLFQNGKYSSSLLLSTLALEEFGKSCMLTDSFEDNDHNIDDKIWKNEFEDHKNKLKAIPKRLQKFNDSKNKTITTALNKIESYLVELSKIKLESTYVDWDANQKNWFYNNDINSSKIQKLAEKAIWVAEWSIEKYIEDIDGDRDLVLSTTSKKIELFRQGKIHNFCKQCSTLMMTPKEMIDHSKRCISVGSWYWNPQNS